MLNLKKICTVYAVSKNKAYFTVLSSLIKILLNNRIP